MVNIVNYIPEGHDNAVGRTMLRTRSGTDDRTVRTVLKKAVDEEVLIINLQDGKGYFIPDMGKEKTLVKKYYKQEFSRAKSVIKTLRLIQKKLGMNDSEIVAMIWELLL